MSTRALYTFRDEDGSEYHVYNHHNGYPGGAVKALCNALPFAWQLPRYEADEFAAAFIAGNKGHYIREELAILRELEALGREAVFGKGSQGREKIAKLMSDLDCARDYAAKGYNGGGVRLCQGKTFEDVAPWDIAYWYLITPTKGGHLLVTAHKVDHVGEWTHKPVKGDPTRWRRVKVPKAKQGWRVEKIFVAPLKTGTSLTRVAEAYENRDVAA